MPSVEEQRAILLTIANHLREIAGKIGPEVNEVIGQAGQVGQMFETSARSELYELQGVVFAASQRIDEALIATLMAGDACEQAAGQL